MLAIARDLMARTRLLSIADRAYVLQSGAIVNSGSAQEMRTDPALAKAYMAAGHN